MGGRTNWNKKKAKGETALKCGCVALLCVCVCVAVSVGARARTLNLLLRAALCHLWDKFAVERNYASCRPFAKSGDPENCWFPFDVPLTPYKQKHQLAFSKRQSKKGHPSALLTRVAPACLKQITPENLHSLDPFDPQPMRYVFLGLARWPPYAKHGVFGILAC